MSNYEIKRIKGGTDNCYLVSHGRDAILFDTGSEKGTPIYEEQTYERPKNNPKLVIKLLTSANGCVNLHL